MAGKPLSQKQIVFLQAYVANGGNEAQACKTVGYVRTSGTSILAKEEAQAYLRVLGFATDAAVAINHSNLTASAERITEELASVAFATIFDVTPMDEEGRLHLISSDDLPPYVRAAVKSIKIKRGRRQEGRGEDAEHWVTEDIEITMHDKISALGTLAKIRGMVVDKAQLTITDDRLKQAVRLSLKENHPDWSDEQIAAEIESAIARKQIQ